MQRKGRMTRADRPVTDILGINERDPDPPAHRNWTADVPRNAPCPCGSGKHYKRCHGSTGWKRMLLRLEHPSLGD
jgi:uncharacterized protein YecA (UPF0149 family)